MWLNYLFFILNTYTLYKIPFLCSFFFMGKETENFSGFFFLAIGLSLLTPVDESWHPPNPASFWEMLVLSVGCLGRRPWQGTFWWIVRLWSCQEQGTPHNSSNHHCWTWKVVPPCVCTADPAGWGTGGFMFPCCHGDLQLTLCTAFP